MVNNKVLYIEISDAHTEIIDSVVESLTPEFEVYLLLNDKSVQKLKHLEKKITVIPLNENEYLSEIIKIKKSLKPDLMLLNSSQGRKVRNLCLRLFFDPISIVGIHHNPESILKSFTQKIIHFKIKKYIVLADSIKNYLIEKKKTNIESFYPLIFPFQKITKINNDLKCIAIPGVLEQDRRDYFGLIELVKKYNPDLDPNIKFVLLGNSKSHNGPEIIQRIQKYGIESRFIVFDNYVEDDVMMSYIISAKAIMPLLHPGTKWFDKYFETKISGAYNLAFSFNKNLLMHEVFKDKEDFIDLGVFYTELSFKNSVSAILEKKAIPRKSKFDTNFQKQKLLSFMAV